MNNINLQSDIKDHLIITSGRSIEDSTSGLIDSLIDVHCAFAVNVTNKCGLPNSLLIAMASEKVNMDELKNWCTYLHRVVHIRM